MSGDAHVRICESLGVQFPRATQLYLKIDGRLVYLWCAVDAEGEVLDVLVQAKSNKRAALKLMRKLLKKYGFLPETLVTDDLRSYHAAARELGIAHRHCTGRWMYLGTGSQPQASWRYAARNSPILGECDNAMSMPIQDRCAQPKAYRR